jgi:tetratricopeptide (TPR) repeat protein
VERNPFADQNRQAKKLDDAVKNVQEAEAVLKTALPAGAFSPESLKVLYMKAELLTAQERHAEALATLDAYDLLAVDEERSAADKLRNQLLFTLNAFLNSTRTRIQSAWTEGNFAEAGRLAEQALRMKADDAEILYYAGMSAAVRRQSTQGRDLLTRYLEVSNTLDAKPEDRAKVVNLLPTLTAPRSPADGAGNWLSGWKVPANAFYCPISLAFQPGIEHIEASGKLRVAFEWDNERLKSVTNAQEGGPSAGEKKIAFVYDDKVPQVIGASDDFGASKDAATLLRNNSQLDPITGKQRHRQERRARHRSSIVFSTRSFGRRSSLPFASPMTSRTGRRRARTSGPAAAPGEQRLEFEWNGAQLMAIRGFLGVPRITSAPCSIRADASVGRDSGQGPPASATLM